MKRLVALLLQLIGALTLFVLVVGGGLVLSAGLWLRMNDTPVASDAIVILAGETRRAIHAADLYHQGIAPVIYLGRPHLEPPQALVDLGYTFPTQEEQMLDILARKGVPREAVHLYGEELMSTVEEAEALRKVLREELGEGPKRLLIVTSPYHCRRAKMILSGILKGDELLMSGTPYERFDEKWWAHQGSSGAVVQEVTKFMFYFLGTPFRSKPAVAVQ